MCSVNLTYYTRKNLGISRVSNLKKREKIIQDPTLNISTLVSSYSPEKASSNADVIEEEIDSDPDDSIRTGTPRFRNVSIKKSVISGLLRSPLIKLQQSLENVDYMQWSPVRTESENIQPEKIPKPLATKRRLCDSPAWKASHLKNFSTFNTARTPPKQFGLSSFSGRIDPLKKSSGLDSFSGFGLLRDDDDDDAEIHSPIRKNTWEHQLPKKYVKQVHFLSYIFINN